MPLLGWKTGSADFQPLQLRPNPRECEHMSFARALGPFAPTAAALHSRYGSISTVSGLMTGSGVVALFTVGVSVAILVAGVEFDVEAVVVSTAIPPTSRSWTASSERP